MWLGGMGRISHHLKGGSNQPQSLASGGGAFESQCFISKHKLLDQGIFFSFFCPRLHLEIRVATVKRVREALVCQVTHVRSSQFFFSFCVNLKNLPESWTQTFCLCSHSLACLSLEIPSIYPHETIWYAIFCTNQLHTESYSGWDEDAHISSGAQLTRWTMKGFKCSSKLC